MFLLAGSAAADVPAVRPDPELQRRSIPERLADAPEPDVPTLWTRWARSLPFLPLDACEVEVESDLSYVRFSLSVQF
jgi:hypothetical protein